MRITNSMMSNSLLMNINRNALLVDKYYTQLASTKKIQYASDDPLIASRALKFRTILAENEQYRKNVDQGISWMDVTDAGISEVNFSINKLRTLINDMDGGEDLDDKKKNITQIQAILQELTTAMNKSYAGRYLFSGYRTNEPAFFTRSDDALKYTDITQSFSLKNLETTKVYHKEGDPDNLIDVTMLKLPYPNVENLTITDKNGVAITVNEISVSNAAAYKPAPGEVNYIKETGELIFSDGAAASDWPVTVVYDKTGFKEGEPNPAVYFTCKDANGVQYDMNNQNIEYEFSVGTKFAVNSLAKDVVSAQMYADIMNLCNSIMNAEVTSEEDLRQQFISQGITDESELKEKIAAAQKQEEDLINSAVADRINNMLDIIDKHASDVSVTQTDLGARINRLELVEDRLKEDYLTFSELMSKNEDVDLYEAAMRLKNADYVYQASMQVGMNMIMLSLVNFL